METPTPIRSSRSNRRGKILAGSIALIGMLLALIAMKFRIFTPPTIDPATTQPHVMGEPEV